MKLPSKLKSIKTAITERMAVRKQLRGPADLSYAIADSIVMLDRDAWQALAGPSGFFMSAAYLESLESVLPRNLAPRYALIYSGSAEERVPVAAVYMQIADVALAQLRPEKERIAPLDDLANNTRQRILTCGNLLTYGQHGIAMAPHADPKLAWHGVAEVLYRVRQAEKLAGKTHFIMIKDLHTPHREHAAHLENLSYRYVETEPNMVLSLQSEWKNHEDYLASLASKYRGNVKNSIFKVMEQAECSVEHATDVAQLQDELFGLYKEVQMNAGVRMFELVPEYFSMLQKAAGDGFRCSVVRKGEKILGFLISVADGETAVAYHIGFDRAAAADLPIYLRLLHAAIGDAISMGCKQISFGRTALEPKAALGCKPQPFGILVRHRQPVLNKMMKQLLLGIEHDEAPDRSPFKKAPPPPKSGKGAKELEAAA